MKIDNATMQTKAGGATPAGGKSRSRSESRSEPGAGPLAHLKRSALSRADGERAVRGGASLKIDHALLYIAGSAFFIMVLLGPAMTFGEGSTAAGQEIGSGSALRQVGYLLILALSIFAALRERGVRALMLPWPLIAALAWCWISMAWAINPDLGLRRVVLTTLTIWSTFILVQSAGYERTLTMLRVILIGLLGVNFAIVFLSPATGQHLMLDSAVATTNVGNWRGIMGHKNVAGATCAFTILLFLFDAGKIRLWLRALAIAASGLFLFMSQSKTSAGMLAIAILCGVIYQFLGERIRAFLIPIIMIVTAIFWFLSSTYSALIMDNYLSATAFTGRGWIWSAMLRYAGDNLMLGSGFGSFWNIGPDSPIYKYGQGFVREVTVGHNGFLDLLVSVGLPGLLLVVFATIVRPTWQLLTSRVLPGRGAVAVALLVFCVGHNATETSLFERDVLVGVMMMVAVAFAHNAKLLGLQPTKRMVGGGDVLAALAQRRREGA